MTTLVDNDIQKAENKYVYLWVYVEMAFGELRRLGRKNPDRRISLEDLKLVKNRLDRRIQRYVKQGHVKHKKAQRRRLRIVD